MKNTAMKKLIKFILLIFFLFNCYIANAAVALDDFVLENSTHKIEYFSTKQNQETIGISNKHDNFVIKNEENSSISTSCAQNNGFARGGAGYFSKLSLDDYFNLISNISFYRIKHSISPLFAYSISTRAP